MPPKRRKRGRSKFAKRPKTSSTTPTAPQAASATTEVRPAVAPASAAVVEKQVTIPKWVSELRETPIIAKKMPVMSKQQVEDGEAVFERDNHGAFLSQSLNDLRKSNTMCDVMLRLPLSGRILQAHRLILRARSPFFRTVFENQVHRNCKNLVVSLPNYVRPAGVEPILDYIYTGLLKVSISTVSEIFQVAWLFKMEDVLAMCRQYCKTQRINPIQVNVMGDHCFLRRDVAHDNEKDVVPPQTVTKLGPTSVTTSANLVPSLGNLKTIVPISSVASPQTLTISHRPTVSMALKMLESAAPIVTTAGLLKQTPALATAQPVQVMPSTLAIPNLPKQLTSLVGNNSVVVLSAGDVMYGGNNKNTPPIPKAVLEQLQALSKNSGSNKQRVFIVKTNSPRSLIKPVSPEAVLYKPSTNEVTTMEGPPEIIECTPTLPENDEDTDSADEYNEDNSALRDDCDEECSELKISNVTSVNDDDDVAPKFLPSAEDESGSSDSCDVVLSTLAKAPNKSAITNDGNRSDQMITSNEKDETLTSTNEHKSTKISEVELSGDSNSSDDISLAKLSAAKAKSKTTNLSDVSSLSKNTEEIVSSVECQNEDFSDTIGDSCDIKDPAVIIFRPKNSAKSKSNDACAKISVKIDAAKQNLHPVIHVLNATQQHRELLLSSSFFHAQVHVGGKCQNVVVTSDSDVHSLSIGNLNYVFPVEHIVEESDIERFANISANTGCGWTTLGSLILKPSADEVKTTQIKDCEANSDAEGNESDSSKPPKLVNNVKEDIETETLLCPICKSSFNSLTGKSNHMMKQHRDSLYRDKDGVDKFLCDACQYKCPSLRRMYFHRFYQHHCNLPDGVAQFRCGLCPSIEYSFVMLKNHYYRYHRGIKSFACDHCGFTSKLLSTLQTHNKLVHSSATAYSVTTVAKTTKTDVV